MFIKGVLKEELDNLLRMKEVYERELANLPKGALIKKRVKGHDYYYVVYRESGKVKFIYKGKYVSPDEINRYQEISAKRREYRRKIKEINEEIKFIRKVLHERRAVKGAD